MQEKLIEESTEVDASRNLAILGLILVSIAPSISVLTGFVFKAGVLAIIVFILRSKFIIF